MVLQNYQNLIEMTSNIIDIVAFGVGLKCPRKINFNTLCPPGSAGTDNTTSVGEPKNQTFAT